MVTANSLRWLLTVGMALWLPALASAQATDEVRYYHTDAIGSVRVITDGNGQVMARHDYWPFGQEWQPPSISNTRRFAGKERDPETGFDYFGGRYYWGVTGRFTTVDPVLSANAAMTDPQRWNRYAYAANRPLAMVDPDGREAGYIYLPSGRVVSPYDAGFTRSQHPIRDTLGLAAAFAGGLFGSPLVDRAVQAGPAIFVGLTRLFNSSIGQDVVQTVAPNPRRAIAVPLGRGSTGRAIAANLREQLALEQAMSNPEAGLVLTKVVMGDSRWPAAQGWVKMSQNINGIVLHYVRNIKTGAVDDFKFSEVQR